MKCIMGSGLQAVWTSLCATLPATLLQCEKLDDCQQYNAQCQCSQCPDTIENCITYDATCRKCTDCSGTLEPVNNGALCVSDESKSGHA